MNRLLIVALFATSAALAGCGKVGSLEQPAPMFGAQAKADYDAKQRLAADARARAKAKNDQPDTPDTGPNYPPLTQAPYATQMPGGMGSPNGSAPQGALPNPGTTPDQ